MRGEAAHPGPGLASSSAGRASFLPQPAVTSLPRGIPLPRAQVSPMTFATKVLRVRYSFSTTPRKMVFISGMPDPGEWTVPGEELDGPGSGGPTSARPSLLALLYRQPEEPGSV